MTAAVRALYGVLPNGEKITLPDTEVGKLQHAILTKFIPHWATSAEVLFMRDAYVVEPSLSRYGVTADTMQILPNVILLDHGRERLFLIEIVATGTLFTVARKEELQHLFAPKPIYINAVASLIEFEPFVEHVAWGTSVWLAETPEHMIHFDNDIAQR